MLKKRQFIGLPILCTWMLLTAAVIAKSPEEKLVANVPTYNPPLVKITTAGNYKLYVEALPFNGNPLARGFRRSDWETTGLTDVAPKSMWIEFRNQSDQQRTVFHPQEDRKSNVGLKERHYLGMIRINSPGSYSVVVDPAKGHSSLVITGPIEDTKGADHSVSKK